MSMILTVSCVGSLALGIVCTEFLIVSIDVHQVPVAWGLQLYSLQGHLQLWISNRIGEKNTCLNSPTGLKFCIGFPNAGTSTGARNFVFSRNDSSDARSFVLHKRRVGTGFMWVTQHTISIASRTNLLVKKFTGQTSPLPIATVPFQSIPTSFTEISKPSSRKPLQQMISSRPPPTVECDANPQNCTWPCGTGEICQNCGRQNWVVLFQRRIWHD